MRLGVADILTQVRARTQKPEDVAAAERVDLNNNRLFLDPVLLGRYPEAIDELYAANGLADLRRADDEAIIASPIDFLAVNHYHHMIIEADATDPHLGGSRRAGRAGDHLPELVGDPGRPLRRARPRPA